MKNNTDTAKAFLKSKGADWWGDNSDFPELLVQYYKYLIEKDGADSEKALNENVTAMNIDRTKPSGYALGWRHCFIWMTK